MLPLLQITLGSSDGFLDPAGLENLYLLVIKLLFLAGTLLYVLFAGIVVRQISIMSETLITSLSTTIKLLGYVHFIFAIGVFIFFLLLL